MTVQLPLFNERYVAERLIDAAAGLDWPRDRLEIQVLDDSTDDTRELCARKVAALRERGIDITHLHRTQRDGFKAGALSAGLAAAGGEFILVLDADFVPPAQLLRRAMVHFSDPQIGMVQTRWAHLNRDYSLLTRVQALLLDGHFVVEQAVRARTGRFFNFNGTAGVWRRQAIEDAGGWQCDTLTEDLDLSYRALLRGWRFEYRLDLTAPAELPVEMNAFKSQQFRWAKGSVQVARKLLPEVIAAPIPWWAKLDAVFHLTQNVPYLLTLMLALLTVPAAVTDDALGPRVGPWLALGTVGILAAYCATSQWMIARRNPLRVLLSLPALIAVTTGLCANQARAVVEGLVGKSSPFVRTAKLGVVGRQPVPGSGRSYRGPRSLVPIAELALGIHFAVAAAVAPLWALPVCVTFAVGFGYVGARSARGS